MHKFGIKADIHLVYEIFNFWLIKIEELFLRGIF
jgi:hypothetical protein